MYKVVANDKHELTIGIIGKIDIEVIYTSMVSNEKSIFVFGGDTEGFFTPSAEARRFDVSRLRWNNLKEMPYYIWDSAAQIVGDKIFIMGGGRRFNYTSYNLAYDIKGDYWEEKASLPMSRKGLVSGVIDDIIYIACGYHIDTGSPRSPHCYAYNPKTDTWKECASAKNPRSMGMSVVVDNFLYVLGGDGGIEGKYYLSMERYCPKTDTWETMPSMPRGRIDSVAVAMDSKIFVLCGKMDEIYTTIDYYDTITRKWTVSDIRIPELVSPGVAVIGNKIYLTAGGNLKAEYNTDLYEITYLGMKE